MSEIKLDYIRNPILMCLFSGSTSRLKLMVICAMKKKLKTGAWCLYGRERFWSSVGC